MKRVSLTLVSVLVLGSSFTFVSGCGEVIADQIGDSTATAPTDEKPPVDQPPTKYCAPDDVDCDGFGKHKPDGGVLDCNDGNAAAHPSIPGYVAEEICNGLDDDCNGQTDEGSTLVTVYRDADGDKYGAADAFMKTCEGSVPAGYVAQSGDCNDADATTNPGAEDKTLDGVDQNCNDVDGATPPTPEQIEPAPAAKPGTLTVTTTKEDRLELSYQLLASYADLGKSWSADPVIEDWADSVTASIPDTQYACGVRIGLTLGGGSGEKWACVDGKASDLIEAIDLTLGDKVTHNVAAEVWLDPNGGCGLYVTWGDACAAPNE